ncbi:MAG: radical SAM protein [Bacteroidales bacterium]|nr:radical SAM protein [Bacteroidales bacterium]
MLREETVFGPIRSRRLGNSLGLNLLPSRGKLCNFDCIYCECGWNADGRDDRTLPTAEMVRSALEDKLSSCMLEGVPIDSITFAGDGEPTLNPEFAAIVDDTLRLRDAYYPDAGVTVLSNATTAGRREVFEALRKVDNPIMKIDAPSNELAALVNRPCGKYDVQEVVTNLEAFEGDFILQTMFLRGGGFDSAAPEVIGPWIDIVRRLRPREVMVYTLDRPTPMQGLEKLSEVEMRDLVKPLLDEGFKIQIKG